LKGKFFIYQFLFLLFLFSCTKETVIPVIVTTDVHGASLAKVADYVSAARDKNSDLILLDNGDILQGTPAVYFYNFAAADKPHMISMIMNHLKYDAGTIGNHDIEAGFLNCRRIEKEFNFPWMSANITLNETKMPLFTPYTIIERKGLKIAVLSLTTLTAQKAVRPEDYEIIKVNDLEESAKKWIELIKKDKNPDVIIGLFHEGFELVKPVAANVSGFDIIFTGHDHLKHNTVIKGPEGKEVLILGAQDRGRSIVHAEIVLKKDKLSFKGEVASLKEAKEQPEFIEFMKQFQENVSNYENSVAAETAIDMTPEIYIEMIHRTLLRLTDAEISISAPVTKNPALKAGRILTRDLFRLYPFDNHPVLVELSGKEITSMLDFSKNLQHSDNPEKRHYNNLSASYKVPLPLKDEQKYKVAMNSYHASDGGGMLSKGAGLDAETIKIRTVKIFSENIREHLFKTENR